jgi:uncharacterized protein with HEPN domain
MNLSGQVTLSNEKINILSLNDILDSILKIEQYTAGFSKEFFSDERKTQDAVVRNFEIIGEASKRASEELKTQYPLVNWKEIVGLGNKMSQEYFEIDYVIVWDIIQNDLPCLKEKIITVIESLSTK